MHKVCEQLEKDLAREEAERARVIRILMAQGEFSLRHNEPFARSNVALFTSLMQTEKEIEVLKYAILLCKENM